MAKKNAPPNVTFWGAAHTVTGSMHLVEAGGLRILLDCGLYQGKRSEAWQRNSIFPFSPKSIDAVILSHAHIDHCGNLPNLFRQGFGGPIFCTPATRDLIAVMLADSAKIQEEDTRYLNKRRAERNEPKIEPLYSRQDVVHCLRLMQSLGYSRDFKLTKDLRFRFEDAGHLLGSAMVHLSLEQKSRPNPLTLTFTGDLGRTGLPILRDPATLPGADLIISECTYGDRIHTPVEDMANQLEAIVRRTVDRGGKVIIPAFSLGRTQTVIYFLHQLASQNRLPNVPIFVDSPLAAAASNVFRLHPECFDEETSLLVEDSPDLFGERLVRYTQSVEESKSLNERPDPCILIAASGMCESGRVVHHLKYNVEDPRSTILIIGFQAPETLGRRIVERRTDLRIHDRYYELKAEVEIMNGFSSHADRDDLLRVLMPHSDAKVCLVHGEAAPAESLSRALVEQGFEDVIYPERGQQILWE